MSYKYVLNSINSCIIEQWKQDQQNIKVWKNTLSRILTHNLTCLRSEQVGRLHLAIVVIYEILVYFFLSYFYYFHKFQEKKSVMLARWKFSLMLKALDNSIRHIGNSAIVNFDYRNIIRKHLEKHENSLL